MNPSPDLVLASASPRRTELLTLMGVGFSVCVTDLEEVLLPGESPWDFVIRMAGEKAMAGLQRTGGDLPVLGADTIVLLDGRILGKPADALEAAEMLRMLSGKVHEVLTAVAVVQPGGQPDTRLNTTRVTFAEMPAEFIEDYCRSAEPLDKAGAYAIQGRTGQYVPRIEGSYSGVMGLPWYETAELLRAACIEF